MKCVLTLLVAVFGVCMSTEDMYFVCNDPSLSAMPEGRLGNPVDNELANKFVIEVHQSMPHTYSPFQNVSVTLRPTFVGDYIKQFILVARTPCDTCSSEIRVPLGSWVMEAVSSVTGNCESEKDMAYELQHSDPVHTVSGKWRAPDIRASVEFVASVIAGDNKVYDNIHSDLLSYKYVEEVEDVHTDRKEFEEKQANPENEEQEGGEQFEQPEEEGANEDANEGERVAEEEFKESMKHDMEGDDEDTDHGLDQEREMAIKADEERRRKIAEEDAASEDGWVKEEYEQRMRDEEEFQNEMMAYEKAQAEEEKKRIELLQWEIRDKEEHDKLMAEEELNRTPKKDDKEPEVIVDELDIIFEEVCQTCGAASYGASFIVVLAAAILKMFM